MKVFMKLTSSDFEYLNEHKTNELCSVHRSISSCKWNRWNYLHHIIQIPIPQFNESHMYSCLKKTRRTYLKSSNTLITWSFSWWRRKSSRGFAISLELTGLFSFRERTKNISKHSSNILICFSWCSNIMFHHLLLCIISIEVQGSRLPAKNETPEKILNEINTFFIHRTLHLHISLIQIIQ